jgi:hypothetical protein
LTGNAEVDPVSGNEVPPGSRPEEVRDDIPAMLSTSEYVVPADVLRYFGVAFFEDLRAQAKEGLAQMDADGRIGGEPVPMEGEDTLPFSPEELQVLGGDEDMQMADMGFANGGMVQGYQEGGATSTGNFMDQFMQRFGTVGSTYFDPQQGALPMPTVPSVGGVGDTGVQGEGVAQEGQVTETRMYVDNRGNMIAITFINGVPQQEIPRGFRPMGEEAPTAIRDSAEGAMWSDGMTAAEIRDAQARGDFTPKGREPAKGFADYTADDWLNWNPSTGQKVRSFLGAALGAAATQSPLGARAGMNIADRLGEGSTIRGYTELNDFLGNLNVNDPRFEELSKKRDDLYSELVDTDRQTDGLLTNVFRSLTGTERAKIPEPTSGSTSMDGVTGTGPFVHDYVADRITPSRFDMGENATSTPRRVDVSGYTPSAIAPTQSSAPPSRPEGLGTHNVMSAQEYARISGTTPTAPDAGRFDMSENATSTPTRVGVPGFTASSIAPTTSTAPPSRPQRSRGGLMGNAKPRKTTRAAKKNKK